MAADNSGVKDVRNPVLAAIPTGIMEGGDFPVCRQLVQLFARVCLGLAVWAIRDHFLAFSFNL